jgi:GNAT superfamily N-acetyltransferase
VAESSEGVVGYSLMTVSRLLHAPGLTAHLQEIVVDEAARGKDVGDRLMQASEHYCMGRGVRQLSASTARIGSFYNHRGFEPVGEHYRKVLELG